MRNVRMFVGAWIAMLVLAITPAHAALLHYSITGMSNQGTLTVTFDLDTTRPFAFVEPDDGVFGYYDLPGNFGPFATADVEFFTSAAKGGFFIDHYFPDDGSAAVFANAVGDTLFSGPVDNPTFLTGTFSAIGSPKDPDFVGRTYSVTVTAVPELATWMMMIVGVGAMGCLARGRRKIALTRSFAAADGRSLSGR